MRHKMLSRSWGNHHGGSYKIENVQKMKVGLIMNMAWKLAIKIITRKYSSQNFPFDTFSFLLIAISYNLVFNEYLLINSSSSFFVCCLTERRIVSTISLAWS
jgi:hypothetical protein